MYYNEVCTVAYNALFKKKKSLFSISIPEKANTFFCLSITIRNHEIYDFKFLALPATF